MAELGDDELIRAVARRDPAALMALYERHGRLAFGLAVRVLGDAATAEEVVQDAFLAVWRHAAAFDPGRGNVRAWLLTIVRHRAIDLRRGRFGRRQTDLALDTVEWAMGGGDPADEVVRTLQGEHVRGAVAALPEEQRRAIELAYFEGLTHGEIAARTGMPLGTVKSRLRLGLRKLHAALRGQGDQGDDGRPDRY